jgi:hypothetical protein
VSATKALKLSLDVHMSQVEWLSKEEIGADVKRKGEQGFGCSSSRSGAVGFRPERGAGRGRRWRRRKGGGGWHGQK